ncbi:uncharacterized protein [Nicotiana tomentosiformis]|uniref:uncharacterized protein n=1 Tax=Nicotiana tomentosiformis TaxID=4098 RepID=UPI00388CBD0E
MEVSCERKLSEHEEHLTRLWLIIGDFNVVLDMNDRSNGSKVHESETRDFRRFLEICGMIELQTTSRYFTWINNHIYSKIDRALATTQWMNLMPPLRVYVMDPYFSDRTPVSIEIDKVSYTRKKLLRFLNCLADHLGFEQVVKNS